MANLLSVRKYMKAEIYSGNSTRIRSGAGYRGAWGLMARET
ncbi:MAG: hypothetical protein ACLQVJ_08765 [Syntrophobacteraceae bacterium]